MQRRYDRLIACALHRLCCIGAVCVALALGGAEAAADDHPAPPDAGGAAPQLPPPGLFGWFNPATAPFIPVPLIGTDPNSGTTLGLLPV